MGNTFLIFRLLVFLFFLQAPLCLNSQFLDLFMNRLVIDLEESGCFGFVSAGIFQDLSEDLPLDSGSALLHDLLKG